MKSTKTKNTTMKPGIYKNLTLEDYLAIDACSSGRLNDLNRSPAHCRYRIDHPEEPTPAQVLGAATDCAILQPLLFDSYYLTAQQCQVETQKKQQCSKPGSWFSIASGIWYCTQHASGAADNQFHQWDPRTIISPDDYATCENMRDSVLAHPAAQVLIQSASDTQLTIIWEDDETGLLCKARPDVYSPALESEADLKTTIDASPEGFEREIWKHGYHRQRYFYSAGLSAVGKAVDHSNLIAVEKEPPYAVGVYRLKAEAMDFAMLEVKALMCQYAFCLEQDHWPAYSTEVIEIGLPKYAGRQIQERMRA